MEARKICIAPSTYLITWGIDIDSGATGTLFQEGYSGYKAIPDKVEKGEFGEIKAWLTE
jgi:hypothetical protein